MSPCSSSETTTFWTLQFQLYKTYFDWYLPALAYKYQS
ncbi:unnamed protein product [Ixodes pacificus]